VIVVSYTTVAPSVGERVSTQYAKLILKNLYLLPQRATDGAQLVSFLIHFLGVSSFPGTTLRGRQSVLFTLRRCLPIWNAVAFYLPLRLVVASLFLV
jgi:hypothetical protein